MPTVYNFVQTRCIDGQHALLMQWYADHVQLLLGSPQLQAAYLQRSTQVLHGQPPDYICGYAFNSRDDFDLFENGREKALATELTNAAAGRSSVEIVQRRQFECLLHRRYGDSNSASPQSLVLQMHSEFAQPLLTARWLGAALQEAKSAMPLRSARVYQSLSEPSALLLEIGMGQADMQDAWRLLNTLLHQTPQYGQAPAQWRIDWVCGSQPMMQWLSD